MTSRDDWDAGSWEGTRRAQLRRSLELTVRERLEALESLGAVAERLAGALPASGPSVVAAEAAGATQQPTTAAATVRKPGSAYATDAEIATEAPPVAETPLPGCAPKPLASYLKALGILRLVAEQADPDARGFWREDRFVLASRLDRAALTRFFLEAYRPTPLVAPWGGRSGFFSGAPEKTAREALEAIERSTLERVADFKAAVAAVRRLLADMGFDEKAKDEDKFVLLRACRAELPDHLLPWLDACYLLTEEKSKFPPLLGTGGNEGSGSYASGFAQQVVACLLERKHDHALTASLFSTNVPGSGSSQTPGQFAPLAGGGPNASTGFSGGITLNPWDFLFCLEGTLLFASAATRRLEGAGRAELSFPFTVRSAGTGSGSLALSDEAAARAEIWLPLWSQPATLDELVAILGEGRVQLQRRTARDGLDLARAIAVLGADRGITEFQRFGLMQRFGRNVVAVPLNRATVRRHPAANLVNELDAWLFWFRRLGRAKGAPARATSLVRRLEDAIFHLLGSAGAAARRVQQLLGILGEAQAYLATSPAARDACPHPVPLLSSEWVRKADDGSTPFRLAAALAGLHGVRRDDDREVVALPMAVHFAPLDPDRREPVWAKSGSRSFVWARGAIEDNLRAVIERRLLDATRLSLPDRPFGARAPAPLHAVAAWLTDGAVGDDVGRMLPGLVLARIPERLRGAGASTQGLPIEASYALLKPFFCTAAQLRKARLLCGATDGEGGPALRLPRELVRLLAANRVDAALEVAVRRLRAAGLPPVTGIAPGSVPGPRLLAALLVPIPDRELRWLVRRVVRPDPGNEQQPTIPRESEE